MSGPAAHHDGGPVPASILPLILDGLREVKESVSRLSVDMNGQLSRLPEIYVPRREVEHRLDEHTIDIGEVRGQVLAKAAKHDADVERLTHMIDATEERRKADEARRQADRRWVVGTVITVAALVVAVLSLVLTRGGG